MISRLAIAITFITVAAGCGDRRTAHLVPVTGGVRQDGLPLDHGMVVFVPIPPFQAPLAFGDIAVDGRYTIRSANKYSGVAPGPYAVCVVSADAPPTESPELDPVLRRGRSRLPPEYGSDTQTPLRCEVSPGGTVYDIDLPAAPGK